MSKRKLPIEQTKIKVSITISRELNKKLDNIAGNKSKLIEELLWKTIN